MNSSQQHMPFEEQHKCLHTALPVKIIYDNETDETVYADVDRLQSNLYERDNHSDRLLDHYLDHQEELAHSKCSCQQYADFILKSTRPVQHFTVRERLIRKLRAQARRS